MASGIVSPDDLLRARVEDLEELVAGLVEIMDRLLEMLEADRADADDLDTAIAGFIQRRKRR